MLQTLTLASRQMWWRLTLLIVTVLLISIAAPFVIPFAAPFAVHAATNDTPTPFVSDGNVEEWAVGAGLVYWGYNCVGDETPSGNNLARVKRKPASGSIEVQLDPVDEDDLDHCQTYQKMLSTADGLYYLEETVDTATIYRIPLDAPYTPQEVKTLTADQVPHNRWPFVEDNGYLYWAASFSNKIVRTLKDGSGEVETVINTPGSPNKFIVVGTKIYWSDTQGVWGQNINCDTLPCTGDPLHFADAGGAVGVSDLLYQRINNPGVLLDGFRLYWVQGNSNVSDTTFSIRYVFCIDNVTCTVLPPINPLDDQSQAAQSQAAQPQATDEATIFYEATVNWRIGNLVLANDNIYWTESNGSANGDVKRKAYNTVQADGADTIATEQAGLDDQLYAVNDRLFFARYLETASAGEGIYTLPLNASVIERDLAMDAMEITQGIQNLANEAPLIGGKATYVRAYGKQISGPSTTNVEAYLTGTRNDQPLPGSPLKAINGVRALVTGGGYDRARLNDGWYFLLPPSWTEPGNVKLQVIIDPRHLHSDPNLSNNVFPAAGPKQVNFQNQPPVCVMTVPVRTHNPIPSVFDPNVGLMVSNFDRRWPVPETWIYRDTDPVEELQVCTWYGVPYPCYGPYELSDGWGLTNGPPDRDKVIVSLWTRAQLTFNPDACDDIGAPVQFMGMVHPDADNGGAAGYASTISNQSWVQLPPHGPIGSAWDAMSEGSTMAQELAHNHGRKHVNCGGPDNIDGNYPYPPCQIAPTGPTSYYGFDIASRRPIRPDEAADFMSYAGKRWVSDYTWRALFGSFAATSVAASSSPAGDPLAGDQDEQFFVTGMVDGEHARGEITIILNVPAGSLPPATRQAALASAASVDHGDNPHVTYSLRLLDANGGVIADRPLVLQPLDDHSDESQAFVFVDIFPKPATPVAQVQLLGGDTVVDSESAGPNLPTVAIQSPAAGAVINDTLTVAWTASDPDEDDRLKFTVQYSHDNGSSWRTLAINLPSTPEISNTLTISAAGVLHGSAPNQALVRVLASDGVHTQSATSQGFTVPNSPPFVVISVPGIDETLPGGEAVLLQGSATDPEDGGLSELTWQVDGANAGSGSTLAVPGLASTAHTATLAATDANSHTVTANVSFRLAPVAVPQSDAPTLDGACNDAGYTESVNLPLSPYAGDTQANVRLLRSGSDLWVCFYNMLTGSTPQGSFVGLRADLDNSRDSSAQADDVGFFVAENGDVFTRIGDGAGDFVAPGPGGLQAQIITDTVGWSAELQIDQAQLGGWGHVINIALGQHNLAADGDDYVWPFAAQWAAPNTWSEAALGIQPVIELISPTSAPVAEAAVAAPVAAALSITVEGSSLVSGTQVTWQGAVLPTTYITAEVLSAQVTGTLLTSAGTFAVAAKSPDGLTSNAINFVVEQAAPEISGFAPVSATAQGPTLSLTINGSHFAPDAQAFWEGVPLPTQFVNAGQLKATVSADLLQTGGTVGITVENPTPTVQTSAVADYVVAASDTSPGAPERFGIYMPGLYKQK